MKLPVDPHLARESEKYENPVASRELILQTLENSDGPMTLNELSAIFGIEDEDSHEGLRRRLRAMERDGQVLRNRRKGYVPLDQSMLVRGRVSAHPDGFGFLVPEEGGDDLFLSPKEMRSVLHGDRVVGQVTKVDRRGRREGSIVEVVERAHEEVVGRYFHENGIGVLQPDNKRITQDILIPEGAEGGAKDGQIVIAALVQQPSRRSQPIGRVVEVLGEHMAPGMEIDIAIRSHELPHKWSSETEAEIATLKSDVPEKAKEGRWDYRETPLVTIDGADARDFDDAVYCEPRDGGWRLVVAIADVSSYVEVGTALDRDALERATSVYFPQQVIPMLPEVLSNGLCSLNPKVDRLCMIVEIQITADGEVGESEFYEGLMNSHARFTYDQVAAMVVDYDEALREEHAELVPYLESLYKMYQAMKGARERRGAIDFETTETYFEFDEDRKIKNIVPLVRNDAHKMIEECMIAANECAAKFLKKHKIPDLHRVHEGPTPEKVADLREFLNGLGIRLQGGEKPEPRHYGEVMEQIKGREDFQLIQTVLLRSLSQAVYSPDGDIGHFGLAKKDYAHFTSPIRRYPDLLVHRGIRHILQGGTADNFAFTYQDMVAYGEHCSMCERRADDATRDASDWLKCEFMMDKIGETYTGMVTGVASFGLFVALDQVYVEGMVHVTALPHDYYEFDPAGHRLKGKRSGVQYRLGDHLEVQVAQVNLDEKKIDFVLAGFQEEETKKPARKRRKPRKKPARKDSGKQSARNKSDEQKGSDN
ncbi:MAG: ribonuclease R [bacterium]